MLDAENELRECSTAAKLEEVFERHSQIITDIPTDLDLTVSYLSEQLVCSLPTVLYREKEQAMIDNMLSEYLERMQGIANAVEGKKLIYEFKTLVAGIKTDSEYEAEELAVLKTEFSSFGEDIDFSLYPTGSHEELRQLPIDFKAELEKTSKTDECKALVERYTAKLSSIYTLEKRLEAGREAWRERWEDMLSSFDDADAVLECLKKIEKQTSGEGADRVGAEFILEHATELAERKSALGIYVNGIATLSDYRQAQREEIRDIADKYRKQIDAADGIEMLLDIKRAWMRK